LEVVENLKMDLFNIFENKKDPFVYAYCEDCDWTGKPENCETYEEDEGWESGRVYNIAICPKCREDNVRFVRKSDYEDFIKEE
jgi:hypothetical protein